MRVIGLMIKQMAMVFTFTSMEQGMRANGKMICNMAKEKKLGLMAQFMRVSTWLARSMDLVSIPGMMVQDTKANGLKIRLEVMELILG